MKASLLILGVLHRGDFHPYEIKRRLANAMVECYTDVDVGTLYYAIRQLEKARLIAAVSRERVPRGGVRTVYRITAAGKAEFLRQLYAQFEDDGPVSQTLYGALLFLHLCDPGTLEDLVRRRISRLDELIVKLGPIRKELQAAISTGGDYLLRHLDKQRRLDRAWLKDLLVVIAGRRIRDVAHPSRLGRTSSQER